MMLSAGAQSAGPVVGTWPNMTADNVPSGFVMSASSYYNASYFAWSAHDGDVATEWVPSSTTAAWIRIEFPEPYIVDSVTVRNAYATGQNWHLSGSNDGSTWTRLMLDSTVMTRVDLVAPAAYKYYQVDIDYHPAYPRVNEWQMTFI